MLYVVGRGMEKYYLSNMLGNVTYVLMIFWIKQEASKVRGCVENECLLDRHPAPINVEGRWNEF